MSGEDTLGALVLLAMFGGVYAAQSGTFYTTGKQWYEGCYEYRAEKKKAGLWVNPEPSDPYKGVLWQQCENIARRGFYRGGNMLAANPRDNSDVEGKSLAEACPNMMTEIPIGGLYFHTLDSIQSNGGIGFFDRFLPAEYVVTQTYKEKWPSCSSTRAKLGYPKIVERKQGAFEWEVPCAKCY